MHIPKPEAGYKVKFLIVLLTFFVIPAAHATCWNLAENTYGVEARLLQAIAVVESNMNPLAYNKNKNGTYDIGLMQINSIHLSRLKKLGVNEKLIKSNACISVMIGASILKNMVNRYGYNWEAVGAYNAGTGKNRSELRRKYAQKVQKVYAGKTLSAG